MDVGVSTEALGVSVGVQSGGGGGGGGGVRKSAETEGAVRLVRGAAPGGVVRVHSSVLPGSSRGGESGGGAGGVGYGGVAASGDATATHRTVMKELQDGSVLLPLRAARAGLAASGGGEEGGEFVRGAVTGNASRSRASAAYSSLRGSFRGEARPVPKSSRHAAPKRTGDMSVGRLSSELRRVRKHIVAAQAEIEAGEESAWAAKHHLQTALGAAVRCPVPGRWPLGVRVKNLVLEAQTVVADFPRSEWLDAGRLGTAALVVHTYAALSRSRAVFHAQPFSSRLHRLVDVARADFAAALVKFEEATTAAERRILQQRASALESAEKRSKRKRGSKKRRKRRKRAPAPHHPTSAPHPTTPPHPTTRFDLGIEEPEPETLEHPSSSALSLGIAAYEALVREELRKAAEAAGGE